MTMGRSKACALAVDASGALLSHCHAVVQGPMADGTVWLTDASTHGTLVLELAKGSAAVISDSITTEQLDALPWGIAAMLDPGAAVALAAARPTLLVLGLHRADWLAGAREGMGAELTAKGAALLVFQQFRGMPAAAAAEGSAVGAGGRAAVAVRWL